MNQLIRQAILASALIAATVMAQTPYDEGQKALREQRWSEAADQFDRAIEADKSRADAAMYWRAHALYKARRNKEAELQVRSLERDFPDSRWVKEARVLQIEYQGGATDAQNSLAGSGLDDELRMFALAQLMDRNPDRALPLVLELMQASESESVRRDALFVLGMSDSPAAHEAIARVVRDNDDPRLQAEAIHMLGAAANGSAIALLAGLYDESGSREVKEAVIHAYIASEDAARLIEILRSEQDPGLQREIIHALGAMDATDELRAMYPGFSDRETKVAALEAFFIAGDTTMLREVLNTETDPELRRTAIQGIAMEGGNDAAAVLESTYDNASTVEEKRTVLEALVMMDDARELALKIVRTETDAGLLRTAIQLLGMMGATGELAGLYDSLEDTELRRAVLESMMIADDTAGLSRVLQSEQDPGLRSTAIQMLAMGDETVAAELLVDLYPNAPREEKKALIESMMIMENVEGLLGLLQQETDPELKREMLQMLSVMDTEAADEYLFQVLEGEG